MTEEEAEEIGRNDRPLLVYVYNEEVDAKASFSIETSVAFYNDKVAVGARLFDAVRMDLEDAKKDRVLRDHLGRDNSLIFLRPDYKFAKAIHFKGTKVKPRAVFAAMCATMKLDYKNCVATTYKKMRVIQKARRKLAPDATKIAKIEDKIEREASEKRRARLTEQRDAMQAKLDAANAKLTAKEDALFALNAKADKNAKAEDCNES